jgi:hypothetical protein
MRRILSACVACYERHQLWRRHQRFARAVQSYEHHALMAALSGNIELQIRNLRTQTYALEQKLKLPPLGNEQIMADKEELCLLRERLMRAEREAREYALRILADCPERQNGMVLSLVPKE